MAFNQRKSSPIVEFNLSLPESSVSEMLWGQILVREVSEAVGIKLEATSGLPGWQFAQSWLLKSKGIIPPSSAIYPNKWQISTQRLWLPNVTEEEGSFYAIAPFEIPVGKIKTGNFGVHRAVKVMGASGGLIVRLPKHWDRFKALMANFRQDGHQQISLNVIYGECSNLMLRWQRPP